MTAGSTLAVPARVPAAPGSRTPLTAVPDQARYSTGDGGPAPVGARQPEDLLTVTVIAGDALTAEGAEAYLRAAEAVRVVEWGAWEDVDIALVLDHQVTDRTLAWMDRVGQETAARGGLPILLVADTIGEPELVRAVRHGLVGVLLRSEADYARVLKAARNALDGDAPMPARLVRSLVDGMRTLATAAERHGIELSVREVDVLRLIAEGLSTTDVAVRLNYSERTIKNVLHELISRLGLRNRTHAVAYAIRRGVV
ncbi:response regulator transcription factor [Streptomyces sp. KL116D]|uniref:response regulator transcription factor n=1 Tax=Streptomyces sp. KL116D TaxID=3045152 RepID=UPI00355657C2